ncbi:MAG: YidC/Oxa1 family membrane protein insertase [Oscillospiraceae bacterium]|jgi:YidC/Oxa1 family membrane protein insertase|nr:YidC/Oxa1 family membrane protein insertase [Oscillospiraceae bacterium]
MTFLYDALGVVFGPIMAVIYAVVKNYGVAIVLFTVFCRLLMLPSAVSQQKNQAKNQRIQYKMRKITEKYKGDRQRLAQEQQEFYRREGYNPMSAGCSGGMVLQFPIIFGLVAAIYRPLQYTVKTSTEVIKALSDQAAEILSDPKLTAANLQVQLRIAENIDKFKGLFGAGKLDMAQFGKIHDFAANFKFMGLQLGLTPKEGGSWAYYLIPVLAGVSSMVTSVYTMLRQRKTNPEQQQNAVMMAVMSLGMPIFSAVLSLSFPVGIGIYWIVSSLAGLVQIVALSYTHPPQKMLAKSMVDETIERRSRENSRKKVAEI